MKRGKKKEPLKSRYIIVYTTSYAVFPYRVVYDSSDFQAKAQDVLDVADEFDKAPAEDSSTKVFRVGPRISNRQLLTGLNGSMEIATKRTIRNWDVSLKAQKTVKKLRDRLKRLIRK